jgi:glycerol kinase
MSPETPIPPAVAALLEGRQRLLITGGGGFIGGAVVQWLRDGLHAIRASSEVQALAEAVPDTGGVHFVPAFTGLGSPYWKPDARGAIVGLTRGTTMAHIARAALESIVPLQPREAVGAGISVDPVGGS